MATVIVRQVFAENLKKEFSLMQQAINGYPCVAIDTEFPGTVFKADKRTIRSNNPDLNYKYMKANIDALSIIQLGLTISDSNGKLPTFGTDSSYVWEFNFSDFDLQNDDCYDAESVELLKNQGIDFEKNRKMGIDSMIFARMIWNTGFFNYFKGINWITFHGAYDFGFLLKILTQKPLPESFELFMAKLVHFFGTNIFDIKHPFRFLDIHGGLERVAQTVNVVRVAGLTHQAGSDSLLTLKCFMKLLKAGLFRHNHETGVLPNLALYGLNPQPNP